MLRTDREGLHPSAGTEETALSSSFSDFAPDYSAKLRWPADAGGASLRRVDDLATRFDCAEISGSKIRSPDVCLQRHRCPHAPPATGGRRGRVQSKALRSAAETARPWP